MELCSLSYRGAVAAVLYGVASATHARVCVCIHVVCSVHARSDRTMDGRYSIAVCRICSLCRDHVLVLIRAPDKIALCYRGSCLRDSREKERERRRITTVPVRFYLRPSLRFALPSSLDLIRGSSCDRMVIRFV